MPIRVFLPAPWRPHTADQAYLYLDATDVRGALAALAARFPSLYSRWHAEGDGPPRKLNIYVNSRCVELPQGLATPLAEGDELAILPAVAGGAGPFSEEQIRRYSRHIILPEIGGKGQQKLLSSRVLIVGAGGLGSPAALYLAAAGVGTLGIADFDDVEASNLQRQIIHTTRDLGRPKVFSAAAKLRDLNPDVKVVPHPLRLTSANALDLLAAYDVVVDASDNFPTRYLANDACVLLGKPLVHGSIYRFDGQATVFLPGQGCYRCLFPSPPPPGAVPTCAEAGVLGVLPGIIGTIQAVEVIKLLLGIGETLAGRLLIFDALAMAFHEVRLRRNPACPVCGDNPSVRELIDYEEFCGLRASPASQRSSSAGE